MISKNKSVKVKNQGIQDELFMVWQALNESRGPIIITECRQPDDPIIYANQAFLDLTGYSKSEVIGNNCRFLQGPDTDPVTVKVLRRAVKNREHVRVQIYNYRKNGMPFWNDLIMSPVKDESGEVTHFIGLQIDDTIRKTLEQQKDDFIAIASHELKTPITSLKAYTQILNIKLKKSQDPTLSELIGKLDAQLNKLTSFIDDLLDVTTIESGKINIRFKDFDFNTLVSEIVHDMQLGVNTHTFVEKMTVPTTVSADRDRIGQVITNFITNAIKYSPHAKKINIITSKTSKELIFSVQDFGIGVPLVDQVKVFERFFRVGGKARLTYPGIGLGLYISKEIIQQHDGRVWIKSIEEKGSVFSFALPLKENK